MTRLPALLILPLLLAGCDAFVPRDESFGETQTRITLRKDPQVARQTVSASRPAGEAAATASAQFSDEAEVDPDYKEPAPEFDSDAGMDLSAPEAPEEDGGW